MTGGRLIFGAVSCTLTACAQVSPEAAARACEDRARAAVRPTGELGVGVGSSGHVRGGVAVTVSSDYLYGRDPHEVYEDCVRQKTGQEPIRPLVLG